MAVSFSWRYYNGGWSDSYSSMSGRNYVGKNTLRTIVKITGLNSDSTRATGQLNLGFFYESTGASKIRCYVYKTAPSVSGTSHPTSGVIGSGSITLLNTKSQTSSYTAFNITNVNIGDATTVYVWFELDSNTSGADFIQLVGNLNNAYIWAASVYTTTRIYTSCSAPTTITASGIVTPSGTFTVSWSGASGGTNNSISSYQIYWRVSSSGASPTTSTYTGTKNITSTSSNGSTTIKLSSATRGYKVVCGVVTRGSAGSDYWSGIKTGGSVTINSQPNKPTISVNKTTLPSTGGNVTFTITAGTDSNSSQTKSVWYSTSSTGTKTKISSSSLTKTVSSTTTYYFWTYDGLEYSEQSTSKTITINTKPEILSISEKTVSSYTVNGDSGASGIYRKGWIYAVTPIIKTNKTGTVTVTSYGKVYDGTASQTSGYTKESTFATFPVTSANTNLTMPNYNMYRSAYDAGIGFGQWGTLIWRLKFTFNDGIEEVSQYFPAEGAYYAINGAPSTGIASYNQFDDHNVSNNWDFIGDNIRISFPEDTSIQSINITAKGSSKGDIQTRIVKSEVENSIRKIDLTLENRPASNEIVTFTVNLWTGIQNKYFSIQKQEIKHIDSLNSLNCQSPINIFNNDEFNVSVTWPFNNDIGNLNTALAEYYCNSDTSESIVIYCNSSPSNTNRVDIKNNNWVKNSDQLKTTKGSEDFWAFAFSTYPEQTGGYAGVKQFYICVELKNLLGQTFSTGWSKKELNFNHLAESLRIEKIEWAQSRTSNNWIQFIEGDKVQESLYLRFTVSFLSYTADDISMNLKLENRSGNNIVVTESYSKSQLSHSSAGEQVENEIKIIYGPVGVISDETVRKWSVTIKNNAGISEASTQIEMAAQKQVPPSIVFRNCECQKNQNNNYEITYDFQVATNGGGGANKISYYIYGDNNNYTERLNELDTSFIGTFQGTKLSLIDGWESKSLCIKSVSTVEGLITRTVNYYSNYIITYILSPTVAYRKNQLGINTLEITQNNAIVELHPASGKSQIILTNGEDALYGLFGQETHSW